MFKKIFNTIKNKIKEELFELFDAGTVTIVKLKSTFVTVDGERHESAEYRWAIIDNVKIPIQDYFMQCHIDNGYIEDVNCTMHLMSNVISITWEIVREKIVSNQYEYNTIVLSEQQERDIAFEELLSEKIGEKTNVQ